MKMQVKYGNFVFYRLLFFIKIVGAVFVSSTISSYGTTQSSILLAQYFPFSQLHTAGLQI